MRFSGSLPALITPFRQGNVDEECLSDLVSWHVTSGSKGVVVCGTTGEGSTVTIEERRRIYEIAVRTAAKRIPVVAGIGSNDTKSAGTQFDLAADAGVDAILHVTGYYNRPSQDQIIEHYKQLARTTALPVIVYNIPSRTGIDLSPATIARLSQLGCVAGVKDSTASVARLSEEKLMIRKEFSFLSGDDASCLGYMAHGGDGCIAVAANVAPKLFSEMIEAAQRGDYSGARTLHEKLVPLHQVLYIEPNPGGIKYALSKLGLCRNELRAPLTTVSPDTQKRIDEAMGHLGPELQRGMH